MTFSDVLNLEKHPCLEKASICRYTVRDAMYKNLSTNPMF